MLVPQHYIGASHPSLTQGIRVLTLLKTHVGSKLPANEGLKSDLLMDILVNCSCT